MMKTQPIRFKYKKPHKLKTFKGRKGLHFAIYTSGLKIKNNALLNHAQLESARRMLTKQLKGRRGSKIKNIKHHKYIKMMQLKAERESKSGNSSKRRKKGKRKFFLIRSTITSPLTKKPLQVRMGKGKGNPYTWVYNIKKSKILMEFSMRWHPLRKINYFLKRALIKLPRESKFIFQPKALKIRELTYFKKQTGKITPYTFFNKQQI